MTPFTVRVWSIQTENFGKSLEELQHWNHFMEVTRQTFFFFFFPFWFHTPLSRRESSSTSTFPHQIHPHEPRSHWLTGGSRTEPQKRQNESSSQLILYFIQKVNIFNRSHKDFLQCFMTSSSRCGSEQLLSFKHRLRPSAAAEVNHCCWIYSTLMNWTTPTRC